MSGSKRQRVLGITRVDFHAQGQVGFGLQDRLDLAGPAAQQGRQVPGIDQRHFIAPHVEHGQHQGDEAVFPARFAEGVVSRATASAGVGSLARQ